MELDDFYIEQKRLAETADQDLITRASTWRTKDGQRVLVMEMTDSHLLNTIHMLQGQSPIGTTFVCPAVRRRGWLNTLANEAYRRGLKLL